MASPGAPLLEAYIYKHTIVGDYVVRRYAQLYPNSFTTRRKEPSVDPEGDCTTYELDHTAKLIPADAVAIEKKKRHIRPHGVGSMTALAAIRGKGQSVELWTFKLEQSHAWDFRFCFDEKSQADQWHAQLSQVIDNLRAAAGIPRTPQSSRPVAPSSEISEGGCRESHAGSLYEATNSNTSSRRMIQVDTFKYLPSSLHTSYIQEDEDTELARLMNFQTGPAHRDRQTHWVPYRHSNGLAIYQHQGQGSRDNEYMVSAVVRGSPPEVLRALLDPSSSTTILGPALEAEVVESTPGRQVLRIKLQALGPTAAWFRPREAVVQRLLKKDEDGVYVVLFSSIDAADDRAADFGVIEIPEGLGGEVQRKNPIRCRVSGGYTISKRQGFRATNSPESLLTCILQVQDMGGWLNPCHPLFRFVDWWSGGAYEAFLERMLLGVMLVRDVVEKSRFVVAPQAFTFHEENEHTQAAQSAEAPFIADDNGKAPPSLRTSTFVMREAATHFSQQAQAAAKPAAGRPMIGNRTPFERVAGSPYSSGSYSVHLAQPGFQTTRPSGTSRLASQRLPGGLVLGLQRSGAAAAAAAAALPHVSKVEEPEPTFKLPSHYYEEIHTPGRDFPFKVRGGSYLTDGVKVHAGQPMFELLGMELVNTGGHKTCPHISRYLSSVRRSSKPFLFVFNLMVPGPPTMCCVFVFGSDTHPDELGTPPDDPEDSDWQPFDFLMWRFINGDDDERRSLFKMIPHIAEGSWLIKQSVGTTPVILARKLSTEFFVTDKYVEVAVDVGSSSTAQYVTGMVRGGARNLVLDLGLVLEGHNSWELPEELVGAVRVRKLDLGAASMLDDSKELPMRPVSTPTQSASAESKA